jgi:hypothetical protein
MLKSNEPFMKRITKELASACLSLPESDYQDLLEEVVSEAEGRLEGLEADRREQE